MEHVSVPACSGPAPARSGPQVTWGFTYNNPTHTGAQLLRLLAPLCKEIVFQKEIGDSGTPHFQGYVKFSKKTRKPSLLLPEMAAHWLRCDANYAAYCQKEDTRIEGPWIVNSARTQGKRSDLVECAELLKAGKSMLVVAESYPSQVIRYQQHFRRFQALYPPQRTKDLEVHLFTGKPGSGKTRAAYEMDPLLFALPVGKDLWFDNYTGQSTVLIDDFAGNVGLTQLLQILDRYPVQVPVKGGFVWWCPNVIIITTNVPLTQWYDYNARQDSLAALKRRITHERNFDNFNDNFVGLNV